MADKQVIKKIVLQLSGKEVSLTPEEAKQLFEALGEMFEKKVVHVYEPYRWYWTYPYYGYGGTTVMPTTTTSVPSVWMAGNGTTASLSGDTLTCSIGG